MANKSTTIKHYCKENIFIKITDFELLDVSFYGCDARFEFEIYDKETETLLDTDYERIENAFMGVDDSEDIYYFLEEKGIDFSEEYDDDFSKLPDDLKKEYEECELSQYNDVYHDYLFDDDGSAQTDIIDKIMKQLYLDNSRFYVIKNDSVEWITANSDYFGTQISSDDLEISRVYNVDMEQYIYDVDGCYFDIIATDWGMRPDYQLTLFKRDELHPHKVTAEDLRNGTYPGYKGHAGDVLYDYDEM